MKRIKLSLLLMLGFCSFIFRNAIGQTSIPSNVSIGIPTQGGVKGKIIRVTTLAPEGPGSIREAIEASGPRVVVFEVGGVIDLQKGILRIAEPFLTLAGQTAPFPGITIIHGGVVISTHDIVIQHIRIRPGDAGEHKKSGWSPDGLTTSGSNAYNIIVDHCSFSWAVDENLSASGTRTKGPDFTSHNITFSNNIIAEALNNSSHEKGPHSKGSLIHDFCRNICVIGNLFAHNDMRNPYFKAHATGVIINNIIYNPGRSGIQLSYVENEWDGAEYEPENCKVSIVGNVLYKGIDSDSSLALVMNKGDAYMEDNLAFEQNGDMAPLTRGVIVLLNQKTAWPRNFEPLSSAKVVQYVIDHVGARPKERDDIDERIIQDFLDKKGRIIDSQEEVGGYPQYKTTYRKLDVPEKDIDQWLSHLASKLE